MKRKYALYLTEEKFNRFKELIEPLGMSPSFFVDTVIKEWVKEFEEMGIEGKKAKDLTVEDIHNMAKMLMESDQEEPEGEKGGKS
jgi:pyrroline-5-carboxylate reductase